MSAEGLGSDRDSGFCADPETFGGLESLRGGFLCAEMLLEAKESVI